MHCEAITPPKIVGDVQQVDMAKIEFYQKVALYVPEASAELYRTTDPWSKFSTINGVPTTIDNCEAETEDAPAVYYNLNGIRVQGQPQRSGIYIREKGGQREKVVIRQR